MEQLAGLEEIFALPGVEALDADMLGAILDEAGKFAGNELAPLNRVGDLEGSHLVDGAVRVPTGFTEAYQQFCEAGWLGLAQDVAYGGQGLPFLLHVAVSEMRASACMAFALCPLLSSSAILALSAHGGSAEKSAFLEKMVSGQWTGTMILTEPQAGSDLGVVKTIAEPEGDHYLLRGQKIFITWGDHEMTDNVVHLVLARITDAPSGSGGLSLFLVPKYLLEADGSLGARNDVRAVSLEHKLGIHASPTCVMSFGDEGGAVGYLIGEPNRGLACMFTMMNHARLEVGLEGVALGERAYQQAVVFARERVQGRVPGQEPGMAIIGHADVRRMLMLMRAHTEAARAVAYVAAGCVDHVHYNPNPDGRAYHEARLGLLTPIVKGWSTEIAQEVTSLGVQIHGGMGYIEETGAAQLFRDARITPIYEGTNGIQAQDLAGRKLSGDGGKAMFALLDEIDEFCTGTAGSAPHVEALKAGAGELRTSAHYILAHASQDPSLSGSVAFSFLMQAGTLLGGWQLARAAVAARQLGDDQLAETKSAMASFYATHILPRAGAYHQTVMTGADSAIALPTDRF
jgi:alkylation response protein AidB-like acyl-CoA dehydrogenase